MADAGLPVDSGTPDASVDAGAPDAGQDAGEPDAGVDAGGVDAGAKIEDVRTPTLIEMRWDTQTLDTSSGPATATLFVQATDDLSGVATMHVTLVGPTYLSMHLDLPGGPATSGTFELPVTLPAHSPAGQWTLRFVSVVDAVGNFTFREHESVPAGVRFLTQAGPGDEEAPTLTSISASTASVDTSTGPATIDVEVAAADDLSGITTVGVGFFGGFPYPSVAGASLDLASGDAINGVWHGQLLLPQHALKASWKVVVTELIDAAGNRRSPTTLQQLWAPLEQTGDGDTTVPVIESISVAEASVDCEEGPATMHVSAQATDDLSGVASVEVEFRSGRLNVGPFPGYQRAKLQLTHADGNQWIGSFTLPRYTITGDWSLDQATVRDASGLGWVGPVFPRATFTVE